MRNAGVRVLGMNLPRYFHGHCLARCFPAWHEFAWDEVEEGLWYLMAHKSSTCVSALVCEVMFWQSERQLSLVGDAHGIFELMTGTKKIFQYLWGGCRYDLFEWDAPAECNGLSCEEKRGCPQMVEFPSELRVRA